MIIIYKHNVLKVLQNNKEILKYTQDTYKEIDQVTSFSYHQHFVNQFLYIGHENGKIKKIQARTI